MKARQNATIPGGRLGADDESAGSHFENDKEGDHMVASGTHYRDLITPIATRRKRVMFSGP